MAVLEYRADGDGELVFAIGAPAQASARLGGFVWFDVGKLALVFALAFWADNTIRPKDFFEMFARLFIRAETVKKLNQREVFVSGFRFHAANLTAFILPSSA